MTIKAIKIHIVLASMMVLVSCGEQKTSADKPPLASQIQETTLTKTAIAALGNSCALSAKDIANIIGWEDYSDPKNMMNSERIQSCLYETRLSGGLTIAFIRYKAKNAQQQYLTKAFNDDLKKTGGKYTYEEIVGVVGDQMIYSYGQDGPNYHYKIRWRLDNHTEKLIDYRSTKKLSSITTLEKLKTIATAIENL